MPVKHSQRSELHLHLPSIRVCCITQLISLLALNELLNICKIISVNFEIVSNIFTCPLKSLLCDALFDLYEFVMAELICICGHVNFLEPCDLINSQISFSYCARLTRKFKRFQLFFNFVNEFALLLFFFALSRFLSGLFSHREFEFY